MAFLRGKFEDGGRHGVFPEEVADQVVFADVGGEVVDARLLLLC